MAVLFVDSEPPVCISADNGGDIFIWGTKLPFEEKPIKRLNEEKDWRYSGIHALAVSQSGSGYFYTGSGDKTIKAWSMHDYSLSSTMSGHKSVVSTLAVCSEVLYSGSWDGTIRLWCLSDHSPLAVLGEEAPTCGSVLSLAAHTHTIVAGHENGCIKIWNNDVPLSPISAHPNSIFSIYMEGDWLFSGGWNKTVAVQKVSGEESRVDVTEIGTISGDSVVTALLYWQGRLFVGQADKIIKKLSGGVYGLMLNDNFFEACGNSFLQMLVQFASMSLLITLIFRIQEFPNDDGFNEGNGNFRVYIFWEDLQERV
ncbi:zinc ion binding protein [Tanacetum coccineum]